MSWVSRLRGSLGIRVILVLRRELGPPAQATYARPFVECRVLSEQAVLEFALDPRLNLNAGAVHAAYGRGEVCLGAVRDRELVGYSWLAFGSIPYRPGVSLRFDSRLRHSYKTFVRPEYRGQRIEQALFTVAERPELCRGRAFAVDFVDLDHRSKRAALQRTRWRPLGYVAYTECFGLVIALRSPGAKSAGIALYGSWRFRIAARMRAWPTPKGT